MVSRQVSPTGLLILLSAAVFLTLVSVLMLGPLLVGLAHEFQTSVALVGQLVAATAITWGITAPLAGPVSDAYGQRRMLLTGLVLMAVGILGAVLAWNYGSLLAFRLLTGVGAAFGVPLVALLFEAGGWRLPFYVMGTAALGVWILGWLWLPQCPRQPGQPLAFFSHYREVGAHGTVWYVLAANALQRMAFFGLFAYLAAHLIQSSHLPAGATALACGAAALASPSVTVTPTLLLEVAGSSRTTATGLFAVSNQMGAFGGPSLGGVLLALGGFPLVGLFFLGVSVLAAVVIRLKVRDSAAFLAQFALRKGTTATE